VFVQRENGVGVRWRNAAKFARLPTSTGTAIAAGASGEPGTRRAQRPSAMLPRVPPPGRRLLDRVRDALAVRHYSPRTARAYLGWIRRFVLFHDRRHPSEMGAAEVARFLSSLATDHAVSGSTQNQALAALLFLYSRVLGRDLAFLADMVHAKKPTRLPVVMTRAEVASVLSQLGSKPRLMASLLYGAGLRLIECASLRVKDLDFDGGQTVVRQGKGSRDRTTVLPRALVEHLRAHLEVKRQHEADLASGAGCVALPYALRAKYPNASREWAWQWVFPATRTYFHRPLGSAGGMPGCRGSQRLPPTAAALPPTAAARCTAGQHDPRRGLCGLLPRDRVFCNGAVTDPAR
jgi:integron integrase